MPSDSNPTTNSAPIDVQSAGISAARGIEKAYLNAGLSYKPAPGESSLTAENNAAHVAAQTAFSMLHKDYLDSLKGPAVKDASNMTQLDWEIHTLQMDLKNSQAYDAAATMWAQKSMDAPMDQKVFQEFANSLTDPFAKQMASRLNSEFNQVARYTDNGEPTDSEYIMFPSSLADQVTLDWNLTRPLAPLPKSGIWATIKGDLGL